MLRWINRIVGILLLLIVIAVASLFLLPADRIAKVAADQIRTATGRNVDISGDVSMTLWPVLGVSADGLEVGNADWAEKGPMLQASDASIGIDLAALLTGEIRITNIEATSPTIRLQSLADGRANWQFTDSEGAASIETTTEPDQAPGAFSIQKLSVKDATLIYDAEGSDLVSYTGVDLALDWPERLGPADINAVLRPSGVPVSLVARIDQFASFLAGDVQGVNAALSGGGSSAKIAGRASLAGEVAGKLTLDLDNTASFLAALGLPAADLPVGLGRSIKGSGDLTLTRDRALALRGLSVDLGGNQIRGDADIELNGKPVVNAKFEAGSLDLKGLTGGGGSTSAAQSSGWSKAAIDASGLAGFDGAIALRASAIDFGSLRLGATRALLRNDNSRMVFELREAAAYDGTLSGEFVVNNRNGLSVGGKMFGKSLQMSSLLGDLAGLTRLSGKADAELKFLGVGGSVHAIMNSLSGDGAFNVGRGAIEGIDLDKLMRSGSGSGGTTVFDSMGATFNMKNGSLSNSDLLVLLRNFEARGKGVVGLGAQNIDYLFTPKALRANDGDGLAIPVRIKGPWSNPKILPDLEAAINLNFAEEKKALEKKVKTEIENRVQKELGVSVEEGQSIEDAVEKKLEDKLKKGLRNLLD